MAGSLFLAFFLIFAFTSIHLSDGQHDQGRDSRNNLFPSRTLNLGVPGVVIGIHFDGGLPSSGYAKLPCQTSPQLLNAVERG